MPPTPPLRCAAIVLAAGASTRFGDIPKALARVGGESAVERIVRVAQEAGVSPTVVVVGAHREEIAFALSRTSAIVVNNSAWARGRTGSVQAGLRAIGADTEVLLWPVDHPFAARSSIDALLVTARHDLLATWLIPTFEGHGGHPVLWRSVVSPLVLDLDPAEPLRVLLPRLGPQVRRLEVGDRGVTENVDSPGAYYEAMQRRREGGSS